MTEQQILESISPEPNTGCWLWTRALDSYGYGSVQFNGKVRKAHRVVYEIHKGPIPEGLEPDHKCRLTCCVNPDHLDIVTHEENGRRAAMFGAPGRRKAQTHCRYGHAFTPENTKMERGGKSRRCRICKGLEQSRRRARKRAA